MDALKQRRRRPAALFGVDAVERRAQNLRFSDGSEVVFRRFRATRRRLAANLAPLARGDALGAIMRLPQPARGGLELVVGQALDLGRPRRGRPARFRQR